MYKPPSDDKRPADETWDDEATGRVQRARPRQGTTPRNTPEKPRKAFYADEHPEIPRVRRASLQKPRVDLLPTVDINDEEEQPAPRPVPPSQTSASLKRVRRERPPVNDEEEQPAPRPAPSSQTSASLKRVRRERPPVNDEEEQPAPRPTPSSQTSASLKRVRRERPPVNDEDEPPTIPLREGQTSAYTRMIRQQGRREMLPFTGLEEEVLPESDTAAWEKLERQTGRQRAYLPDPVTPDPLPRRQTGTKVSSRHAHTHRSTYTRTRFFGRKRSWVLIGLLALVVLLISTPALINTLRNASLNNANSPQGISLNKLQSIPSNPHELVVVPPDSAHPAPPILATSAYLLDASTDTTYYALNPFLHLPMLSTTKLMTATLAVEEGNLDQQITITAAMEHDIKQLSADSALFGVKEGETYTLRDLLYGLLFVSGNDAALVIADALAGNEQNFVAQMNQKAQELGLRDTHFVNPHGLLAAGQYSCARDLAVLGLYSLSIPTIKQISNEKTYHMAAGGNHPARVLLNENQFLWWYPGVDAGKTGYDGESDFVQVMLVTRNNRTMVGVVMHTDDWWTDMRDLMDYGSNDYTWVSPRDVDASGQPIPYDNLWNYFAKDTTDLTVAEPNGGAYFVYTGYSVDGPILSYFNKQGGLKKFGYPEQLAVAASGSLINQQFQHGIIQCNLSNNQCQTL